MRKTVLLKLADLLEADAKNKQGVKFDLGIWAKMHDPDAPHSCGTTACAMGLAAISGAFKENGLTYDGDPSWITVVYRDPKNKDAPAHTGLAAADKLFGISRRTSAWLFLRQNYRKDLTKEAKGERAVARRIRAFVNGEKRAPKNAW